MTKTEDKSVQLNKDVLESNEKLLKKIDDLENKLKKLTTSSKNYMTKKSVENCFNNFIKSKNFISEDS